MGKWAPPLAKSIFLNQFVWSVQSFWVQKTFNLWHFFLLLPLATGSFSQKLCSLPTKNVKTEVGVEFVIDLIDFSRSPEISPLNLFEKSSFIRQTLLLCQFIFLQVLWEIPFWCRKISREIWFLSDTPYSPSIMPIICINKESSVLNVHATEKFF